MGFEGMVTAAGGKWRGTLVSARAHCDDDGDVRFARLHCRKLKAQAPPGSRCKPESYFQDTNGTVTNANSKASGFINLTQGGMYCWKRGAQSDKRWHISAPTRLR